MFNFGAHVSPKIKHYPLRNPAHIFVWDFPHLVIACELYLSPRAKRLSRGFYLGSSSKNFVQRHSSYCDYSYDSYIYWHGCCFMAHFDLVLRLGGCLRPKVLVLETLAAEFIFDVPFIIRWVNICFLYMYMHEILG